MTETKEKVKKPGFFYNMFKWYIRFLHNQIYYKKTYQDEKAIVNCIEKYKTEKSVRIDETAFDAQARTFNNAKKLFGF